MLNHESMSATKVIAAVIKTVNLTVMRGDTFDISFALTDPTNNDEPLDLSGCTALMQIRKKSQTGTVLQELTDADGISIADGVIAFDKIIDCEAGDHYWDLQLTYTDGKVKTYFGGIATVLQDVSTNA